MLYITTYETIQEANKALDKLMESGVAENQISVATMNKDVQDSLQKNIADNTSAGGIGEVVKDTVGGVVSGGALGAVGGLLAGMAAFTIPGLGGLLITGPLAAALGLSGLAATAATGAGIGGTAAGVSAFVGSLVKSGMSDEDAQKLESAVKDGQILIALNGNSEEEKMLLAQTSTNKLYILDK